MTTISVSRKVSGKPVECTFALITIRSFNYDLVVLLGNGRFEL